MYLLYSFDLGARTWYRPNRKMNRNKEHHVRFRIISFHQSLRFRVLVSFRTVVTVGEKTDNESFFLIRLNLNKLTRMLEDKFISAFAHHLPIIT